MPQKEHTRCLSRDSPAVQLSWRHGNQLLGPLLFTQHVNRRQGHVLLLGLDSYFRVNAGHWAAARVGKEVKRCGPGLIWTAPRQRLPWRCREGGARHRARSCRGAPPPRLQGEWGRALGAQAGRPPGAGGGGRSARGPWEGARPGREAGKDRTSARALRAGPRAGRGALRSARRGRVGRRCEVRRESGVSLSPGPCGVGRGPLGGRRS